MFKDRDNYKPLAKKDIKNFCDLIKNRESFCFVRYSDGEMEIIRNRYLKIGAGQTHFKGKVFKNNFTDLDSKEFDPKRDRELREDLLKSAILSMPKYFKGLPHKRFQKDRDLLLTIHGGIDEHITFADLLVNSNYLYFRKNLLPFFESYKDIYLVANYRAKPIDILGSALHLKIPDNLFFNYKSIKKEILEQLINVPSGSLILSSASSLSNIIGAELFNKRKDITFIDVGTSINDLIGLEKITRTYHEVYFSKGIKSFLTKLRPSFYIRW